MAGAFLHRLGAFNPAAAPSGLQYVGGKTFTATTTGSKTISLTDLTGGLASAPAEGDLVLVAYTIASGTLPALSITTSGYTETNEFSQSDSNRCTLAFYYKVMGSTPDTDVTVNGTAVTTFSLAVAIHVWRGADTVTPSDVTTTTAQAPDTGQPNPPSITPSTSGAVVIVVGAASAGTGGVFTQSGSELSNFITANAVHTFDAAIGIGSYQWSSGAFDPAAWLGGSTASTSSWCSLCFAIRPA